MVDIERAVIARLKIHGSDFEILVDCDNALKFKEGQDIAMDDILAADKVFSDAKKGLLASETQMHTIFKSSDTADVAQIILKKGEIQVTAEHRSQLRNQKFKKILDMIHTNGVDPRTGLPHPRNRLELAFDEAKIKIDEYKSAEEQVESIIKLLRPILPINVEKKRIALKIPPLYAGKAYSAVQGFGQLKQDEWLTDGSWTCIVEIPAGLQADLFDKVNKITHGDVETKILQGES